MSQALFPHVNGGRTIKDPTRSRTDHHVNLHILLLRLPWRRVVFFIPGVLTLRRRGLPPLVIPSRASPPLPAWGTHSVGSRGRRGNGVSRRRHQRPPDETSGRRYGRAGNPRRPRTGSRAVAQLPATEATRLRSTACCPVLRREAVEALSPKIRWDRLTGTQPTLPALPAALHLGPAISIRRPRPRPAAEPSLPQDDARRRPRTVLASSYRDRSGRGSSRRTYRHGHAGEQDIDERRGSRVATRLPGGRGVVTPSLRLGAPVSCVGVNRGGWGRGTWRWGGDGRRPAGGRVLEGGRRARSGRRRRAGGGTGAREGEGGGAETRATLLEINGKKI